MNKSAILLIVMAHLFSSNAFAENNSKNINDRQQRFLLNQDSTSGTNYNNLPSTVSNNTYSCGRQPTTTTQACSGNYNSGYINTTTYTTCNSSTGVQQQHQTSSNNCSCNVPSPTTITGQCSAGYEGNVIYTRNYYCANGATTYSDTVTKNNCAQVEYVPSCGMWDGEKMCTWYKKLNGQFLVDNNNSNIVVGHSTEGVIDWVIDSSIVLPGNWQSSSYRIGKPISTTPKR